MRNDLEMPILAERPLVGDVESLEGSHPGYRWEGGHRDDAIIQYLREKLRGRGPGNRQGAPGDRPDGAADHSGEDKYEPQRLNRKICWQYDSHAKRVPILRRHYI